jgi:hypothetical protein
MSLIGQKFKIKEEYFSKGFLPKELFGVEHIITNEDVNCKINFKLDEDGKEIFRKIEYFGKIVSFKYHIMNNPYTLWWVDINNIELIGKGNGNGRNRRTSSKTS